MQPAQILEIVVIFSLSMAGLLFYKFTCKIKRARVT